MGTQMQAGCKCEPNERRKKQKKMRSRQAWVDTGRGVARQVGTLRKRRVNTESHVDRLVCFQDLHLSVPTLAHLCMDVYESFFSHFFSYFSVCILPMHACTWQCLSMPPPPTCIWFPVLTPACLCNESGE